ncbi:MAG: hypothetical protein J5710_01865 [Treponema sp.]|nr:hypothetical protein [Treponema sp.]MBR5646383.1 hypothetical protein [Treponema sp.]
MKRPVIFLQNDKNEDSIPKVLLFCLNFIFVIIAFLGGRYMPFGILLYPPIFIVSSIVSVYYLIKSIKNHTFELYTLYLLPAFISLIIGMRIDSADTKKTKNQLLQAQSYVEQYYEQNGSLPDNNDEKLKELHVQISGEIYDEGYDYELHGHGARIRRGDDHVFLYPRP